MLRTQEHFKGRLPHSRAFLGLSAALASASVLCFLPVPAALATQCSQKSIRRSVQVIQEYRTDEISLRIPNYDKTNQSFQKYVELTLALLLPKLEKEFCRKINPPPEIQIIFIRRPLIVNNGVDANRDIRSTLLQITASKHLNSPWVTISQDNRKFQAVYFFNERQFVYDQAQYALLGLQQSPYQLSQNQNLVPISESLILTFYRNFHATRRVSQGAGYEEMNWFIGLARNVADPSSVTLHILANSLNGYTGLSMFLTNEFFSNPAQRLEYRNVLELPQAFGKEQYRLRNPRTLDGL